MSLRSSLKEPYSIPAAPVERCVEIKKSKFIARVAHVSDRPMAMELLAQAKLDYPDARHYCWAYLIGPPTQPISAAFSDDGEPSGTAGKPILNVLNHRGIGDVQVMVVRYFGGIKLGAGGLVRAYSSATRQVIELLVTKVLVPKVELTICFEYAFEPELRRFIEALQGTIISTDYEMDLALHVVIPVAEQYALQAFVAGRKGLALLDPSNMMPGTRR
jgi:uncharacterized YigZ family protein